MYRRNAIRYQPRRKYVPRAYSVARTPAATSSAPTPKRATTARPRRSPTRGSLGRTALTTIGSLAGRGIGALVGGPTGSQIGSSIGGFIGDSASTILGMGAYSIKSNTVISDASQVPAMHSHNETIRVTHREYIGDVYSSGTAGAFKINSYSINPGLHQSFPWLAPIAQCFQEYEIMGFAAMFKSNSGDALNSTNTALGSITMAAQYNVLHPDFNSKSDMLNSMWSAEGKPSNNVVLPIECDPSQNPFAIHYVRSGDIPNGQNLQNYDLCKISVASVGCQGTSVNLGELWFTYDVVLRKPSIYAHNEGLTEEQAHYTQYACTTATAAAPFTDMIEVGDDIGVDVLSGQTIRFRAGSEGTYMINWTGIGASGAETPYVLTLVNCTFANVFAGSQSSITYSTGASTLYGGCYFITITDPSKPADIFFSDGTIPAGAVNADLFIIKYNRHTADI